MQTFTRSSSSTPAWMLAVFVGKSAAFWCVCGLYRLFTLKRPRVVSVFLWLMPAQCHIRVRARERRLRISVPSLRRIEYHQGWWVRGLILVKDDAWTSVSHAELEFFANRQNRPPDPGGIRRVLYEAGFEPNGECYYCGRTVGIGSYFCPGHDSTFTKAWFSNPALWPILAEAVRIHVANWRPPVDQ